MASGQLDDTCQPYELSELQFYIDVSTNALASLAGGPGRSVAARRWSALRRRGAALSCRRLAAPAAARVADLLGMSEGEMCALLGKNDTDYTVTATTEDEAYDINSNW